MGEKRPNFIIVMTDQQRADLRKGRGYALDTMPFLEEWSRGGVDFERAYTPNPTCMPARVSMFTGRYSQAHRVRTNHNARDVLYTSDLLDVLKENGYTTALCGKNHSHRSLTDFDFCETNGHLGYEGEENGTQEERDFADFLCSTNHMEVDHPSPGGIRVQHPYRNVSSALKFIDETGGKQPFFAWVSFAEPHNPYQVPEPYFDLFPPDSLPAPQSGMEALSGKGERFEWLGEIWKDVLGPEREKRVLRARSNYHGMLRLIDDQLKRLIEGLRERGLEEDTIVVYLSDHGDFVGEYGLIRKGVDLPDLLTRIPMIWRGPGIRACGKEGTSYVSIVDILPTICDILGVKVPFGCQGKSILPLLNGEKIPEGEFDTAYAESGFSGLYWREGDELTPEAEGAVVPGKSGNCAAGGGDGGSRAGAGFDCLNTWTQCGQVRAVWHEGWHLQLDMMGTGHLYHTDEDPCELRDLWENAGCQEIKMKMLELLAAAMMKAADPLPAPHYRYRTKVHPKGYWNQDFRAEDPGVRE